MVFFFFVAVVVEALSEDFRCVLSMWKENGLQQTPLVTITSDTMLEETRRLNALGGFSSASWLKPQYIKLFLSYLSYPVVSSRIITSVCCGRVISCHPPFVSSVSQISSLLFFLYLHSSHTVAKIRARIPSANSPYLALVSGGSQVYIVLHEEEADEHSVIKMFAAAW